MEAQIISLIIAAAGIAVSYLAFRREIGKSTSSEGENKGVIISDIGYIKAGIDDLKNEQKQLNAEMARLNERVTRCEESCKQAHKRIDECASK